ncbi:MAG: prepilin-type N-terminal cleavage/methylation domain-containing protein [Candidatus Paceibacteria bacterium]|jgi:prepilin-type N-terminal cleavage/methylation domain-containing protein
MQIPHHKPTQGGFTLIELLVVIAIIGILASVVLAALDDSRTSAREAAVIQQLHSLGLLMELNNLAVPGPYYTTGNRSDWISNDGVLANDECDLISLNGIATKNIDRFREICESIAKQTPYRGPSMMLIRWYRGTGSSGTLHSDGIRFLSAINHYSIAVRTNAAGTNIACVGSSGGRYVGVTNPGGGSHFGPGCFRNP